jgi:hypothetical protein
MGVEVGQQLAIADGNDPGMDDGLRGHEIDIGSDRTPLNSPVQHVAGHVTQ